MAAHADSVQRTRASQPGAVQTRGAILREPGTRSGWHVEDIEIDPPKEGEVLIKLAASGHVPLGRSRQHGRHPARLGPDHRRPRGRRCRRGGRPERPRSGGRAITSCYDVPPLLRPVPLLRQRPPRTCATSAPACSPGTAPGRHPPHPSRADGTPVGARSPAWARSRPTACAPALSVHEDRQGHPAALRGADRLRRADRLGLGRLRGRDRDRRHRRRDRHRAASA